MPAYLLGAADSARLLAMPESGMGFQWIRAAVRLESKASSAMPTERLLVLNASIALPERTVDESSAAVAALLALAEDASAVYRDILSKAVRASLSGIEMDRPLGGGRLAVSVRESGGGDGSAAAALPTATAPPDSFRRFSAYSNDMRVTSSGGLVPKTYATTAADATHVKTGTQAVDRYALPNPAPAAFRFRIDPPAGTPIQGGIAQPAYGRKGGGVEVIFTAGSPPSTVTGPVSIPP